MRDIIDFELKKYLNGDPVAFRKVYDLTKKSVFLSIHSLIRDNNKIEDLMQETYMKALESLKSYQLGSNFKAWISTIARNKTLDYLRAKKELILPITDFSEVLQDNFPSELLYEIRKILTEVEYKIFIYHVLLDYTYRDIADMLEMKLKEVAYIYKKSRDKLKRNMEVL